MSSKVFTYRTSPAIRNVPFPRTPWWRRLRLWAVWRVHRRQRKRREIEDTMIRVRDLVFSYQPPEPTIIEFEWSPLYKKYSVCVSFGESWWGGVMDPLDVLEHDADHLLSTIKSEMDKRVHNLHSSLLHFTKDAPDGAFLSKDFCERLKEAVRVARMRKEVCDCQEPYKEKP